MSRLRDLSSPKSSDGDRRGFWCSHSCPQPCFFVRSGTAETAAATSASQGLLGLRECLFRNHSITGAIRALLTVLVVMACHVGGFAGDIPDQKQVDVAIKGGLQWLAENQVKQGSDAGSWDAEKYRSAGASLAGLAFLANGYTADDKVYGPVLKRVMGYVRKTMREDGYLGALDQQMYVHAFCALFGLSYLGTVKNPEAEKALAGWCRKSIKIIIDAQKVSKPDYAQGGWRYTPYAKTSDISVSSWMLLTLHAASQCGYKIDQDVIQQALDYINRSYTEYEEKILDADGKPTGRKRVLRGFLYRVGVSKVPEAPATGIAVFIKSILEEKQDEKVRASLDFLKTAPPVWGAEHYNGYFYFAAFYITQGMFHVGGKDWEVYSGQIKKILVEHQNGDGSWPFPPNNKVESIKAGKAYATAMAILILSLEKQYLPMYQRQQKLY